MKKLATLIFCLSSTYALSQALTTTTATLTDSSGQVWSQAQWTTTFIPPFGNPSPPNNQGQPISPSQSGIANTSGFFTVNVDDNNVVAPAGSKWKFTICPNASVVACTEVQLIITGPSMDISAQLNAAISPPVVGSQPTIVRAYKDVEVNGSFGVFYSNTIDNLLRQCQLIFCAGTGWVIIGGGGSGTTVEVNGVTATSPANFNNTTPTAPTNGANIFWQLSGGSISAAVIGNGNATNCLSGAGTYVPCSTSGGGVGGSGTAGIVPVWTAATTLGNSNISSSPVLVQIGSPALVPSASVGLTSGVLTSVNAVTPSCGGSNTTPLAIPSFTANIGCIGQRILYTTSSSTTTGVNAGLFVQSNGASSSGGILGMGIFASESASFSTPETRAGYFEAFDSLNTTITTRRGLMAFAGNGTGNTTTNNEGIVAQTEAVSGSTNTNDYSMHCLAPLGTGTMTTHACVKIEAQGKGVELQTGAHVFANLPACSSTYEGSLSAITDSTVAGGIITGGGTIHVMGYCNGTSWIVLGSGAADVGYSHVQLTANQAIAQNTNTTITQLVKTITMPPSCPCRVFATYGLFLSTANSGVAVAWVNDGTDTHTFAASQTETTGAASGYGLDASEYSPVTYAAGAVVTFNGRIEVSNSGGVTVNQFSNNSPTTNESSYLQLLLVPSNGVVQ